ncbi:unnamed protein product [Nippostrongylus brasiliensis]|uniref:LP15633p (inferred by orthology to a D. melanogaster protein) n=1 Tax=Nippostrongylus brasiliensis TaxID=27835 RepID=A0A158R2K4_NIPBR|nr:unnamed protein product [Nippostrongylus brasiliensis]
MFLTAETEFGANLLRQSPATETLVVSPISVVFALAMVQAGAKGKTKTQITNAIAKGNLANYYANLSSQIRNAKENVIADIANGFFLNKQFTIEKSYQNTIVTKYSAKVQSLNFGNAAAAAKIEFMNAYAKYQLYAEDADVQVLSLPYRDESFAFNVILPKSRFGLAQLRSKLTGSRIQGLLSKLKSTSVTSFRKKETIMLFGNSIKSTVLQYTLPKMKIETDFKLKEALVAMGVSEIFADSADLSGITKSPPLKISKATHRAIIEVDEDGTTAAAATVLAATFSALMPVDQPKIFRADHPFWFILTKDKNPLFMGQFTDFGANMLRHVPANESLVVSPISVIFALAMVQAGAKGKTKSQITNAIAKGSSDADLQNFYSNLSSQVRKAKNGVRADIANGFFLNKQYTIDKNYENTIVKKYSAKVQSLDFKNTKAAAKTIDDFIKKTTQGKIQNMVTPDMVNEALIAMGLTDMFTDKADFSGITKSPPLKISDAAHRAIIEVDEDGTTAAAATVLVAVGAGMPVAQPKIFNADHPFCGSLRLNGNSNLIAPSSAIGFKWQGSLNLEEGDESTVVSPISVIFALAMLEAGAKGKTKSQIADVIAKENSDGDLQNYYSNLSSQIQQARNDGKAYIANGFFLNKQYTIDEEYESTVIKNYSADVQSLDFTSTSDAAKVVFFYFR